MSDLNGQMLWIDLDQIAPPDDPRESTEAEIADLAANIALNGQLEPGMVEPLSDPLVQGEGIKPWRLVFGWHRFQALRRLNYRQMKCEVREGLLPLERHRIILAENSKRSTPSPFFQARILAQMQRELQSQNPSATQKDLAQQAGLNESEVSDTLAIGQIPEDLKAQFTAANFPFSKLREIIRAENSTQLQQLSELALQSSLSAEGIKAALKKLKKGSRKAAARPESKLWPGLPDGVQFKSQARYHHLIWPEGLYTPELLDKIRACAPITITAKRRNHDHS